MPQSDFVLDPDETDAFRTRKLRALVGTEDLGSTELRDRFFDGIDAEVDGHRIRQAHARTQRVDQSRTANR